MLRQWERQTSIVMQNVLVNQATDFRCPKILYFLIG